MYVINLYFSYIWSNARYHSFSWMNTSFCLVGTVSICFSLSATGLGSRNYRSFTGSNPNKGLRWPNTDANPQMTLDDANRETTYKTTTLCYKFDDPTLIGNIYSLLLIVFTICLITCHNCMILLRGVKHLSNFTWLLILKYYFGGFVLYSSTI